MNEYVGTNSSVVLYVDMYSRDQWFDSRWSHVLGLQCAAKEKLQCSCMALCSGARSVHVLRLRGTGF